MSLLHFGFNEEVSQLRYYETLLSAITADQEKIMALADTNDLNHMISKSL